MLITRKLAAKSSSRSWPQLMDGALELAATENENKLVAHNNNSTRSKGQAVNGQKVNDEPKAAKSPAQPRQSKAKSVTRKL